MQRVADGSREVPIESLYNSLSGRQAPTQVVDELVDERGDECFPGKRIENA